MISHRVHIDACYIYHKPTRLKNNFVMAFWPLSRFKMSHLNIYNFDAYYIQLARTYLKSDIAVVVKNIKFKRSTGV